jgi:hypothetical protein
MHGELHLLDTSGRHAFALQHHQFHPLEAWTVGYQTWRHSTNGDLPVPSARSLLRLHGPDTGVA